MRRHPRTLALLTWTLAASTWAATTDAHAKRRVSAKRRASGSSPEASADPFAPARARKADGALLVASGLAMADLRHAKKVPDDANWTPALWLHAPPQMMTLTAPTKVALDDPTQAARRCPREYELTFYRGHDAVSDGWFSGECAVWVPDDRRGRRLRVEGELRWRTAGLLERARAGEAWLVRVRFPVETPVATAHAALARLDLPSLDRHGERGRRPSVTVLAEAATETEARRKLTTVVRAACRARACRAERLAPRPSPTGSGAIVAATVIGEDAFRIDELCKRADAAGLRCADRATPTEYTLDTVVPWVPSKGALAELERKLGARAVEAVPSL